MIQEEGGSSSRVTTEAETGVNTATTLGTLEATRSWKGQGRVLHLSLFVFGCIWFGMTWFGFFTTLYSMQDLSPLTRDQTCAP